jgi:hypothetical protein
MDGERERLYPSHRLGISSRNDLTRFFPCGCSSVDRVLASEAKGRWFDPSQPHHPVRNLPLPVQLPRYLFPRLTGILRLAAYAAATVPLLLSYAGRLTKTAHPVRRFLALHSKQVKVLSRHSALSGTDLGGLRVGNDTGLALEKAPGAFLHYQLWRTIGPLEEGSR